MKRWDPVWKNLPPVEPVKADPLPPRTLTYEEMRSAREQYERTHLRAVLEKEKSNAD